MAIQTFTAGQVLTAAQMNSVQQQAVMTFTTEAARDAALPSPTEGMVAYLTAPTVPAATGAETFLPTGIMTAYDGSAWVCISEVGAFTAATGTTTSSSFTATLSGTPGTNPSVTLETGTKALITVFTQFKCSANNGETMMSVAVSGASSVSASRDFAVYQIGVANLEITSSMTFMLSGLTAGTNTFTLQYFCNAGTGQFRYRRIVAQGIL